MILWTPYHINPSVQAVVYLVVPDDGVAACPDLHASQGVAMDVVLLQHATPVGKEVHAPVHPSVDLVILEGGIALSRDPHTGICVGINLVLDKLATSL